MNIMVCLKYQRQRVLSLQTTKSWSVWKGVMIVFLLSVSQSAKSVSFESDLALLKKHFAPIVLESGYSKLIVVGELQGRVMVSTFGDQHGQSIGWINRDYLKNEHLDYSSGAGGASRLYFGPETGPFSFFFKPNTTQTGDNVVVPDAFSSIPYDLVFQSKHYVKFNKEIKIQNYSGYEFEVEIEREIELFGIENINRQLGLVIPETISSVGFGVLTKITNSGKRKWSFSEGVPSIWELSAFYPSDKTTVVIPFRGKLRPLKDYFTPLERSHLRVLDGRVYYKADANYLNKIGIAPENTLPVFGSYDAENNLLTIVKFQFDAKYQHYNIAFWNDKTVNPYEGDVINVFNDGLDADGKRFGPFYELESLSSAKALNSQESNHHFQNVFHFSGSKEHLNKVAVSLLGVSLATIENVFNK